MEQEIVSTRLNDAKSAVEDLCRQLKNPPAFYTNAVIFLADISYDFEGLSVLLKEKFSQAQVIGCTTAGEIDASGFKNGSIVLTTMQDSSTRVSSVLIEKGSKYPLAYKKDIENALKECGIPLNSPTSHLNAFALTFINAVYNSEETILSNFYSIIQNDDFPLAGATAGYTGSEAKSFISCNGKVTGDGAVMLFVKTKCKFTIQQEDMFNPTGKNVYVTKSDTVKRKIYELDGKPALSVYANELGLSEDKTKELSIESAFGRHINGSLHIAAVAAYGNDKSISTYARIVPNSTLEIMHVGDVEKKCDETCASITRVIPKPKFVLLMNCILRTIYFGQKGYSSKIISKYKNAFPTFCGFSCYGEQIGRAHCSETLVVLAIGD